MSDVRQIDALTAAAYFERLDPLVREGTELCVIGGSAVARLPERFRDDVVVRDSLANLESDILLWKGLCP